MEREGNTATVIIILIIYDTDRTVNNIIIHIYRCFKNIKSLNSSTTHLWRFIARCTAKISKNCDYVVYVIGQICQLEAYHRRITRDSIKN